MRIYCSSTPASGFAISPVLQGRRPKCGETSAWRIRPHCCRKLDAYIVQLNRMRSLLATGDGRCDRDDLCQRAARPPELGTRHRIGGKQAREGGD